MSKHNMHAELNPSPVDHPDKLDRVDYKAIQARFIDAGGATVALTTPLSAEDCQAQSMPDACPIKWHLAHVTWFLETFTLERFEPNFVPFDRTFKSRFNSYYNAIDGDRPPRDQRGVLTRPALTTILSWREQIDQRILKLLDSQVTQSVIELIEFGIQHGQQHQEFILTDLEHLLSSSALRSVYKSQWPLAQVSPQPQDWASFSGGMVQIGHTGQGFGFDNEFPLHSLFLGPYELSTRLVTHGEWAQFAADGGHQSPTWWLSAGWDWVQANKIDAPLYWYRQMYGWQSFTLHGCVPIDPHTPIPHISLFEADAYARWLGTNDPAFAGPRLPTQAEWEAAVSPTEAVHIAAGNFVNSAALHPMPVRSGSVLADTQNRAGLLQAMGDAWQWTSSSDSAYPGFAPWGGDVGEYNGKFMINQYMLRGGSCITPKDHIRPSYRNFFPAHTRWQFTGLRLARSLRGAQFSLN